MSRLGEAKTAREIGGRTQPASGATPWAKGDAKSAELLIERKDTFSSRYPLKASELLKLRGQAILEDRVPIFIVSLHGSNPPLEVAVLDSAYLFELLEAKNVPTDR